MHRISIDKVLACIEIIDNCNNCCPAHNAVLARVKLKSKNWTDWKSDWSTDWNRESWTVPP